MKSFNDLRTFATNLSSLLFQADFRSLSKEIMNSMWAILAGATLHPQNNNNNSTSDICPLDFDANNQTLNSYISADVKNSISISLPQLTLTSVILIPVAWYLAKKFRSYFFHNQAVVNSHEDYLAKPAEIMKLLTEIHIQTVSDVVESFQSSLTIGPSLASIIFLISEPWLDEKISYLADRNLNIDIKMQIKFCIYIVLALLNIKMSYLFLSHKSTQRKQRLLNNIADHTTAITIQEINFYKKIPVSMLINSYLFPFVTPIFMLSMFKITSKAIKPLILLYFPVIFGANWLLINALSNKRSKEKNKINNFIQLCQKTITYDSKLASCIQVTKDSDGAVIIQAINRPLFGFPRHIWFGEMVAFCKGKFGHNPLYIDSKKFTIQMIPINSIELGKEENWQEFSVRVKEIEKMKKIFKNFTSSGNEFFHEYFNIFNAIKLIPYYNDSKATTFTLQINITSLEEKRREKIESIIRQEIPNIEVNNLMGILNIGPIKDISRQQIIRIQKKLKQEFKPDFKTQYSIGTHEFHFFNPSQLYWKPKKSKSKIVNEKKPSELVTQLFEQKPIYFDDEFGTFNPNNPKCLIKRLPDGPPNTFITMHPDLRSELKDTDWAEDIAWFTEDFDEKIHKPPTIQKTHEKINADGSIPIFKIYFLRDESRATCNQWGQVAQQGKIYTLYIVDEYYNKLHKRTSRVSTSRQQTAEKRQMISFNLS